MPGRINETGKNWKKSKGILWGSYGKKKGITGRDDYSNPGNHGDKIKKKKGHC